ncbi:MAG: FAD-dependent oxidoreductase, partial [Actinomycetales bacterium]
MPSSRHTTVFERQEPPADLVARSLAGSEHRVFWLDDAPSAEHAPLVGAIEIDLTVVGGGYAGLWTAVLAKRRDPSRRVVLLEAESIGWAASGRNGGFAEASLTHGEDNGRSRWPDEYDTLERLGLKNLDALERDASELGIDAQLERTGVMAVAYEPHQVEWLAELEHGTFLDEAGVRAEINSPTFLAGRWTQGDSALVHPARLARGLAQAAVDLGVEIFEHSRVQRLRAGRTGAVELTTPGGTVRTAQVALATNV